MPFSSGTLPLTQIGRASSRNRQLYWTQFGVTASVNDGEALRQFHFSEGRDIDQLTGSLPLFAPYGIAVDQKNDKVYFSDFTSNALYLADLDGENRQQILGSPDIFNPTDISLDLGMDQIYIADLAFDRIARCNLDGSNFTVLVSGLPNPIGLELDLGAGKMYWTEETSGRVRRSNVDGSNIENLLSLTEPRGLALDLVGKKMYVVDGAEDRIYISDLDGSNSSIIVESPEEIANPQLILFDQIEQIIVWANFGCDSIAIAEADGSNPRVLLDSSSGILNPVGVALYENFDFIPLSIFGRDNVSDSLELIVCGFEPKPEFVCPVVETTGSIIITDALITIYQTRIDALINQIGKNLKLVYDNNKIECPNCEFDPIRNRSRGKPKPGGPRPFKPPRQCPYCKARGFVETTNELCIKALTQWNPKDAVDYGISISKNRDLVKFKTQTIYYDDLIRARFAIANSDISGVDIFRVRLKQTPILTGLRESRYCVSFWERVD